ncbi:hypothetical protein CYMTET_10845 [Cymbomonas tetramitiformis]|uniref:Uncharacterized protein n=1 Tax=Cymbomonas tetramitiformis TaxID=36881 RepID=A0AAE0LDK9_9CHLO|nr:hypothetical protein CYMTET_10845 [Cymbomonas tetramitiformis]
MCHSERLTDVWLRIDLGYASVSEVHLYNRLDCCADRLGTHEIWVGNAASGPTASGNSQCYSGEAASDSTTVVDTCSSAVEGRYVYLLLPGSSRVISIEEMQAFGTGIYVDGPRADANGVAACASWIGTLAEAQAKCDADASCKVLHDDGCDDENWRYCSSVPYTTSGGGCTKVPSTGLLLKSEFSDVVDQATGDSATLADSAALAGSTLCTNGAGYAQWYANAARTFSGDWALEMTFVQLEQHAIRGWFGSWHHHVRE